MSYYCEKCDKYWQHEVQKCIFCGSEIIKRESDTFNVISKTTVRIPSKGNEKVPYFVYLLEDKFGQKRHLKSLLNYPIAAVINLADSNVNHRNIGVVGTGLMGLQIAEYLIDIGYPVILKTRDEISIKKSVEKIKKHFSKRYTEAEIEKRIRNLTITLNYDCFSDCELIIEAVAENILIKKEVFEHLSSVCQKSTIFATNSSSLSIDELAKVTDRPGNVIGCHFFNPVSKMELIEVVVGKQTSDKTRENIISFSKEIFKQPILVQNSPGFIVNRLLLPQINDAIRLLENGISTKEGIDAAMKMGLNHPMGPFALADFIGLDVCAAILNVLYQESGDEHFKPAISLQKLVNEGKFGYKTGEGFYKY